jgi:hypothetical protein
VFKRLGPAFAALLITCTIGFAQETAGPTQTNSGSGHAGISSVAAGGGIVLPLGDDYVALGTAAAFHADVFVSSPGLGPDFDWRVSGFYLPFTVNNMPNATAKIGLIGLLGGLDYHAPGTIGRVSPYFGLQLGAVYEFMTFPGSVGSTQNAAISLGVRAMPGVEIPFGSSVSALVDIPIMAIVNKRTTLIGGTTLSLRFNL